MPLAITKIIVSGVAFSLAGIGGAVQSQQTAAEAPIVVDTTSQTSRPASAEGRVTCTLISNDFGTCVWSVDGVWVIGDCSRPPAPNCPT
ncbi:MAG: hypothetical protein GYB49_12080 [Alphaproteobacteria bacterium]|nr:hypothetical protein [Hyphomonas sp.]MBR9807949.1 hypothetical protein [Alphaproteobacteria bacterium]